MEASVVQAIVILMLAVAAYLRSRSTNPRINPTGARVEQVHELVNSRMTTVVADVKALADYITKNAKPGDPQPPTLQSELPPPNVPQA